MGTERDYNRLDGADDPLLLEKEFARLEGLAAPVIQRLIKTEKIPGALEEYGLLMNFISLLHARGPAMRRRVDAFFASVRKRGMRELVESPERYLNVVREYQDEKGDSRVELPSHEEFKRFVADGTIRTRERLQDAHYAHATLRIHDEGLNDFALRHWSVMVRRVEPLFISSDCPVFVTWTNLPIVPERLRDWAHLSYRNTEVTVPLSRHVAMRGTFERQSVGHVDLGIDDLATVNTRSILAAAREVYAPSDSVLWRDRDGSLSDAEGMSQYFAAQPFQARVGPFAYELSHHRRP